MVASRGDSQSAADSDSGMGSWIDNLRHLPSVTDEVIRIFKFRILNTSFLKDLSDTHSPSTIMIMLI